MPNFRKGNDLQDLRSTGRKRARAVLLELVELGEVEFACNFDLPDGTKCAWRPVGELGRNNNLDCNHINKDISDCDPVNLEWLCRKHHKLVDSQTDRGVSIVEDEHGYFV